jgi:tRNA uridine 5-carboxymethylaminomethyl modification enzyme
VPSFEQYSKEALEQILIEAKYYRYIQKQKSQIDRMHEMLKVKIPQDFDYDSVQGLSNEVVEKLKAANPPNLQSASLISGITPAALEILHVYIKMRQRGKK